MWQNPVQVATVSGERFEPAAVADGSGGVIVAWNEGRSGGCYRDVRVDCDIYAQRLDGTGARMWGADGVAVVIAERNQGIDGIALASDGHGGVYAAWEDARPPDCCKVFAQRLDASGQPQWADGGILVSIEPFFVFGPMVAPPQIVADGQGGAILVWIENQVDPLDGLPPLHAQRLDSNGDALWTLYGVPVGLPANVTFDIASDRAGGVLLAYITWKGPGTFPSEMILQRVDDTGSKKWGADGVLAGSSSYYMHAPEVVSDGDGGAITAWVQHKYDWQAHKDTADIHAQRVEGDGTLAWQAGGQPVCTLDGDQDNVLVVADNNGGAIVAWKDCRNYMDRDPCFEQADLYAQHFDSAGNELRLPQGEAISKAPGNQGVPQGTPVVESSIRATTDMAGGAILAWPDGRQNLCLYSTMITDCDVFAQRTNTNLLPPSPCADANQDGLRTSVDALIALNAAVNLTTCALSRCDIDDNGTITATDALGILNTAIGLAVDLACPAA
jgi:hypothetical protein